MITDVIGLVNNIRLTPPRQLCSMCLHRYRRRCSSHFNPERGGNMSSNHTTTRAEGRDLFLERVIDAPPHKVYQAWTDPELMKQWFVPRPWTIASVENDIRPGGKSLVVMRSPEGQEFPNPGVFLDV